MDNAKSITIYLAEPGQIRIAGTEYFHGRPVDFSLSLSELSAAGAPDLGDLLLSILREWHPLHFAAEALPQPPADPLFGDLEIVENLIARSVRHSTTRHNATIEDLLANHAPDQREKHWAALAEDWPKLRARIARSEKQI